MKDTLELSHVPSAMWGHSEKASCVALAIHRICVCLGLPYLQNCEKPVSVVYQPPTWLLVFCLSTRNGLGPWAMCGDALGSSWLSGDCLENWNSWLQPTGQRGSPWLCSSVSVLCTPHGGLPDPHTPSSAVGGKCAHPVRCPRSLWCGKKKMSELSYR